MSNPALWYASRATGLLRLVLLTATLVLGVLTRKGVPLPTLPKFVTPALHRSISLVAVAFLAVHVVTAVLDPYAMTGVVDVLVPFGSGYRPFWVGLGTVAADLLIAVMVTSLLRLRIPTKVWRTVHWAGYACWPVALAHGLGSGTDATARWSVAVTGLCLTAAATALTWRVASGGTRVPALR